MPHIIIEYSASLSDHCDIKELLSDLRTALIKRSDAEIDPARVLTRAYKSESYINIEQFPDHFVAIQLRILPGRSPETRKSLASDLQESARKFLAREKLKACVTVEPVEMDIGYCGSTYQI